MSMKLKYLLLGLKYWYRRKIKDKRTVFVVYGDLNIDYEHAQDFLSAIQDLRMYGGDRFDVIFTGRSNYNILNPHIAKKITFLDIKDDFELEKVCNQADYFLPIFPMPDDVFLKMRSYEKPFVIHYQKVYDFNLLEDGCIYYENYFELCDYMKRAIFMTTKDYVKMCQNIKTERISVFSRKIGNNK